MTPAQVAHIMSLVDEYAEARIVCHPVADKARAAVEAALRDAPQQAEPIISTEHGPWLPSKYSAEEGEMYCQRCMLRDKFTGARDCKPHIVYETPSAPTAVEPDERAATETQAVLIEVVEYTVPMPVAAEMLRLHMDAIDDAERLNWIELAATRRKVEIARSILGAGYEIGEWPSMRVTVKSGTLREAIDAARTQKGKA